MTFCLYLVLFFASTLIMHLLSEYDAFRSSYISDASDEPLSFFVSFYDIPQINKNIQSSPMYIHFQEKFFMKKVRKLRVPWESIWTICFWKVPCLFAMVFCPVFLWSSLVGQKTYRYYYVSGEFLEMLRKQPKLKFSYIW